MSADDDEQIVGSVTQSKWQEQVWSPDRPAPTILASPQSKDNRIVVARGRGEFSGTEEPAPTILTHGRVKTYSERGVSTSTRQPRAVDGVLPFETKPAYRIPTMAEIRALETTGYRVLHAFSGCGGSCLGFKLAGYTPIWASEFIPAARETYAANHPEVPLDARDIRQVTPEAIRAVIGDGEIHVMEGSPPCASFSVAGSREAGWGQVRKYSDTKQRVDDLFGEFLRLVAGLRPLVVVAENVPGLRLGAAMAYYREIIAGFERAGYVVAARVLNAQWFGVPQARRRLIFVAVRKDLGREPIFPEASTYFYTVRDALPWLDGGSSVIGGRSSEGAHTRIEPITSTDTPSPAILAERHGMHLETPAGTIGDVTDDGVFESDLDAALVADAAELAAVDMSAYAVGAEWDTLGQGEGSEKYFSLVRARADLPSPTVTASGKNPTAASVAHPTERRKFTIAELKRICGFPDDFILTGTREQQWERLGRAVPPPLMAAVAATIRDKLLTPLFTQEDF